MSSSNRPRLDRTVNKVFSSRSLWLNLRLKKTWRLSSSTVLASLRKCRAKQRTPKAAVCSPETRLFTRLLSRRSLDLTLLTSSRLRHTLVLEQSTVIIRNRYQEDRHRHHQHLGPVLHLTSSSVSVSLYTFAFSCGHLDDVLSSPPSP